MNKKKTINKKQAKVTKETSEPVIAFVLMVCGAILAYLNITYIDLNTPSHLFFDFVPGEFFSENFYRTTKNCPIIEPTIIKNPIINPNVPINSTSIAPIVKADPKNDVPLLIKWLRSLGSICPPIEWVTIYTPREEGPLVFKRTQHNNDHIKKNMIGLCLFITLCLVCFGIFRLILYLLGYKWEGRDGKKWD
jgi:heme/copper-type cytochrome/quinol oxidase subunit 4